MPWWWSRARPFLEPELEAWHLEAWGWLLRHLGGLGQLRLTPLVTPTRDAFAPTERTGHARAEHVFAEVKRLAGMADWPCRLVQQPQAPVLRLGELAAVLPKSAPAGTFGLEEQEPVITYDPALLRDPGQLVATLAHELAHLALAGVPEPPPGGRKAEERVTDLATVVLGFGLFGANCAFNFGRTSDTFSQGWSSQRLGYLDEREWAFALAVFLSLTGQDAAAARRFLKPHLFSDLRTALASLRRRPALLDPLRDDDGAPRPAR